MIRIWYCTDFVGHYPVGSAFIIVGETRVKARHQAQRLLKEHGLAQTIKVSQLVELNTTIPNEVMLVDGNY